MLSNASKHHCLRISESETLKGVLNLKLYDLKKLEFFKDFAKLHLQDGTTKILKRVPASDLQLRHDDNDEDDDDDDHHQ